MSQPRILIVKDGAEVFDILSRYPVRSRYRVAPAADGDGALMPA